MDELARTMGVRPVLVPSLGRDLGARDFAALSSLLRIMVTFRPHVLHTHAAKAGTIGRTAAILAGPWGPRVRVHTFHGHVLAGYFSPTKERLFRRVERGLARRTTRLIAVSDEVRGDLERLGVAPPGVTDVVPLGFDLSSFAAMAGRRTEARAAFRAELGLDPQASVVTLVARLAPIKRVDRFLRIARSIARRAAHPVHFVIVGDGELHDALRGSDDAEHLNGWLHWTGMRTDMPAVCAASDVVVLTSDNEGTPVSLIEALAAATPVVATAVGGVPSVVGDSRTGRAVAPEDEDGFAAAVVRTLDDPETSRAWARDRQREVLRRFDVERLVNDIDALYRDLLARGPAR